MHVSEKYVSCIVLQCLAEYFICRRAYTSRLVSGCGLSFNHALISHGYASALLAGEAALFTASRAADFHNGDGADVVDAARNARRGKLSDAK